jgi:hypothetical protein
MEGRGTMGALLTLPVARDGQCLIDPKKVGLITESNIAMLLLAQPVPENRDVCTCHSADYRATHEQSRIIIVDCEGEQHVFEVLTSILEILLTAGYLHEKTDGIKCTKLQGATLKSTDRGNDRAAIIIEHRGSCCR